MVNKIYTTPIYENGGGDHVGDFKWSGTLYKGNGYMAPLDEKYDTRIKQARSIARSRTDLLRVWFHSLGERSKVKGWNGFEGTYGALRLCLPAVGLRLGPPPQEAMEDWSK